MAKEPRRPLAVGDTFHGYAGGAFGRDHYDCMRVIETGPDWIRLEDANGTRMTEEGVDRLASLMQTRDDYAYKCTEEDGCPLENMVQLTEAGGFFRVGENSRAWKKV